VSTFAPTQAPPVSKSKKPTPPQSDPDDEQFNFRAPPELAARIRATAKRLGLDKSNFIRMALIKILPHYESEAGMDAEDKS
jgi:hypothetical protein